MKRTLFAATLICAPFAVTAGPSVPDIIEGHILPRFDALASASQSLSRAALQDCELRSPDLRDAYGVAFDAWVAASHLRFGPTEVDDRAFALAFWPDSRGATPRTLATLIADQDPIANKPDTYGAVSIAARGFYAMEFLLYDETLMQAGNADYHCTLVQTVAADIAATSAAIYDDWTGDYVDVLLSPGPDAPYRNEEEVLQEMLRALSAGLQFTQESRLGRPLGTFDRPRPRRAEARRSERSLRHIQLSLAALEHLATAMTDTDLTQTRAAFAQARSRANAIDDPALQGVADPAQRFKVEVLQQAVRAVQVAVIDDIGTPLGITAGFNALDGD